MMRLQRYQIRQDINGEERKEKKKEGRDPTLKFKDNNEFEQQQLSHKWSKTFKSNMYGSEPIPSS